MVVKHNITAMNSNRMLGITTSAQAKSTEKLSSGYKINRAADDAAGLAISEKMRKQIRGLTQASANAQDGISCVQTAEGALNEVQDMLQRMNELSVKAANGTMSESDREAIQNEVDQLTTEIDRVSETTKFNETYLLKGDQDVSKVATYKYGNYTTGVAAKVVNADGDTELEAANGLTMEVTFDVNAKQDDQNALAKALVSQGAAIEYSSSWPATDAAATEGYKLTLNGSAGTNYTAVAKADGVSFEIQDVNGNAIATIEVGGGTAVAKKGDPDVNISTTITATKATAAQVKDEIAAIYDRDGNKIAANALDNYFSLDTDGNTVARVDAPDAYDALGNKVKLADYTALVSGEKDLTGALTLSLHVGADATSNNQISINLKAMSAKGLGVNGLKVDGADDTNALNAIDTIKEAIQKVSDQRAELGAVQNRLEHTINNLDNVVENTTSAEAQIRDTDIATEMVQYSNNNILQQAGTSMLSQANQSNQLALSLLG
ncbi:MAG: hypothetical protein J6A08_03150 [Lachnospiraceae bacterium]|nr:hypothetical protein [Lachnospiraceae bacterium]